MSAKIYKMEDRFKPKVLNKTKVEAETNRLKKERAKLLDSYEKHAKIAMSLGIISAICCTISLIIAR